MEAGATTNPLAQRLFYSVEGRIFVSAILGLGLALLFKKVCNDRSCIVTRAPPLHEIEGHVYELEGEYWVYTPYAVKC